MTATEELRKLLEERGVEHGGSDAVVYFADKRGYKACAYDAPRRYGDGVLCVCHTATPEQAIAATLGGGECAMIPSFTTPGTLDDCQEFCCSVCGEYMVIQQFPGCEEAVPSYCPNCGRKVMDA